MLPGSPLVFVDVKVEAVDGAENIVLSTPDIAYYRNKTDLTDEVVIPYIGEQSSIKVTFSSTADDSAIWVNVHGFDLAGNEYPLFNGTLIAIPPEPEPEPEEEPDRPGGIPGFSIEAVLVGVLLSLLLFWYSHRRAHSFSGFNLILALIDRYFI